MEYSVLGCKARTNRITEFGNILKCTWEMVGKVDGGIEVHST